MNLEQQLSNDVLAILQDLYGNDISEGQIQLQKTRKEFDGDITLVVFPFLKLSKKGPEQTGEEIGAQLVEKLELVTAFNCVKGFLNLEIADSHWIGQLESIANEQTYGSGGGANDTVMVEYSSPNTNKPLHLGHMRNIFLGHSVAKILEFHGKKVHHHARKESEHCMDPRSRRPSPS